MLPENLPNSLYEEGKVRRAKRQQTSRHQHNDGWFYHPGLIVMIVIQDTPLSPYTARLPNLAGADGGRGTCCVHTVYMLQSATLIAWCVISRCRGLGLAEK